jgi:hypothetical protein
VSLARPSAAPEVFFLRAIAPKVYTNAERSTEVIPACVTPTKKIHVEDVAKEPYKENVLQAGDETRNELNESLRREPANLFQQKDYRKNSHQHQALVDHKISGLPQDLSGRLSHVRLG